MPGKALRSKSPRATSQRLQSCWQSSRLPVSNPPTAQAWATWRRTPPTPQSMFRWECSLPAHPAQKGIRPARRWPHRTAGNPHRTPRECAPLLRRAAHADARQSQFRDAPRSPQLTVSAICSGVASPTVSASEICRHASVNQQSARIRSPPARSTHRHRDFRTPWRDRPRCPAPRPLASARIAFSTSSDSSGV